MESAVRFSVEWLGGAPNACAEERATLCRLRIFVGDENACVFYDPQTDEKYDHVIAPAVHLAEGIATDWWSIVGGRDREHSLLPWRTGFVLPNVRLKFDGVTFEVAGDQLHCDNPKLASGLSTPKRFPVMRRNPFWRISSNGSSTSLPARVSRTAKSLSAGRGSRSHARIPKSVHSVKRLERWASILTQSPTRTPRLSTRQVTCSSARR